MEIITNTETARKAAEMLGLVSRYDEELKRSDFTSDDAYLDALTKRELERSSPEYREARKRIEAEYTRQQEAEQRKADAERMAEIRKTVRISDYEKNNIDREAYEMAKRDLANNKISRAGFADAVIKHAEELEERLKTSKATDISMNEMLRNAAKNR